MVRKEKRGLFASREQDSDLAKVFARKVIRIQGSNEEGAKNERDALNLIHRNGPHINIIDVFKHGRLDTPEEVYFIDMELADLSLHDYIGYFFPGEGKPLSSLRIPSGEFDPVFSRTNIINHSKIERLHATCAIGVQIASGLRFLHDGGLAHRDLKPHN